MYHFFDSLQHMVNFSHFLNKIVIKFCNVHSQNIEHSISFWRAINFKMQFLSISNLQYIALDCDYYFKFIITASLITRKVITRLLPASIITYDDKKVTIC